MKARKASISIFFEVDKPSARFVEYVKDMAEHLPVEARHWAEEGRIDTNRSPVRNLSMQRKLLIHKEETVIVAVKEVT